MKILESEKEKVIISENYNHVFNKETGLSIRWGKTLEDDPDVCEFGPEIADIEITTICHGVKDKNGVEQPCKFCYKSNTPNGSNMSFDTFKKIFHKLPRTLTQIAFGADSHATSNPDLFKIMDYCRNNDYNYVVPNITVADISDETADKLSELCGAVAVSRYANKELCYDSVKKLTDRGMKQINIHILVSDNTYDMVMETLKDRLTDERLQKMNAIVLLSLKKKGRGVNFTSLSQDKFKQIVQFAFHNNIAIGFDSCSCYKFLDSIKNTTGFEEMKKYTEPCESGRMSIYINTEGKVFPCSFSEETDLKEDWKDGIDIVECNDFLSDVWSCDKMMKWKTDLINNCDNHLNCIKCPIYEV